MTNITIIGSVALIATLGTVMLSLNKAGLLEEIKVTDWIQAIFIIILVLVTIMYARDTNRIANQTIEASLRPVIYRSGSIINWDIQSTEDLSVDSNEIEPIKLINYKNIAVEIQGYVILDNKKYTLLFWNEASQRTEKGVQKQSLFTEWGWLPEGGVVNVTFEKIKYIKTDESNHIYITYKDIEGNSYCMKEDSEHKQKICNL